MLVTLFQFLPKLCTDGFPLCQALVPMLSVLPTQPHTVCLTSHCTARENILRSSLNKTFPYWKKFEFFPFQLEKIKKMLPSIQQSSPIPAVKMKILL